VTGNPGTGRKSESLTVRSTGTPMGAKHGLGTGTRRLLDLFPLNG
jgi:hypothetical protein